MDYLYNKGDNIAYTVIALIVAVSGFLGFLCGALLFNESHESACSEELIELSKLKIQISDLQRELNQCKSVNAGKDALKCESVCAKQVKSALERQKQWNCDD